MPPSIWARAWKPAFVLSFMTMPIVAGVTYLNRHRGAFDPTGRDAIGIVLDIVIGGTFNAVVLFCLPTVLVLKLTSNFKDKEN